MHLNPAQHVVSILGGGPRPASTRLEKLGYKCHFTTIAGWLRREQVPPHWQVAILQTAERHDLDITARDLILGRTVRGKR